MHRLPYILKMTITKLYIRWSKSNSDLHSLSGSYNYLMKFVHTHIHVSVCLVEKFIYIYHRINFFMLFDIKILSITCSPKTFKKIFTRTRPLLPIVQLWCGFWLNLFFVRHFRLDLTNSVTLRFSFLIYVSQHQAATGLKG